MGAITELAEIASWERVWEELAVDAAAPAIIFKASPYCGVSRAAESRFKTFVETLDDDATVGLYRVDVVNARDVSQRIAADTGVTHASPQALLLAAGRRVAWNASHFAISEDALKEALSKL